MKEELQKSVTVTLVHGTWAKDAPWTQEESKLSQALNDAGFEVDRLSWGSWNRFTTRRDAAQKLQTHIDHRPENDHFIIAHSHGGNVAVRALDGDDSRVKGVVSLNTPFFNILGRDPKILESVFLFIAIALSMIPVGLWLGYDYGWKAALVYLLIIIGVGIAGFLYQLIYKYIQKKGQAYHFRPLLQTPFLCINTPDDEAYGVLAFLSSLQNFLFLSLSRSAINSKLVGILIATLILFQNLPFLHLPWDLWLGRGLFIEGVFSHPSYQFIANDPISWLPSAAKVFALLMLTALYYLGIYALFAIAALTALSIIVTLSQGFIAPLSGLFNRFIVTLVPLKSQNVKFVEKLGDATSLRHSSLYNDQQTINEILLWIDEHR